MSRWLRRALGVAIVCGVALVAGAGTGCSDAPTVSSSDLDEFRALLRGGMTYGEDPFVRAESLRVVEMLQASAFRQQVRRRLEDEDPMVRVAALRALLATESPKATARAVRLFSDATVPVKRGVLQAVLEYSTESAQRDMLWRAIKPEQPAEVRRYAFRNGLVPRVERTMEEGNESFVRKLFLPNVNEFLTELDTEMGGPVLELMLQYDELERAQPVIDEFRDQQNSVARRLRAAEILIDAGAESARSAFRDVLDEADTDTTQGRLALPEQQMDERLVRAAILGIVAAGDKPHVSQAKRYMKDASADEYVEVLEALAHNPSESARLSLENALRDARPRVRNAAVELYAPREDADVDVLLSVHQNKQFERGTLETRRAIARAIDQHFGDGWVATLRNKLASEEGVVPALMLLKHVHGENGDTRPIEMVKKDLLRVAKSDRPRAVPLAAYLLVQLAPDKRDAETDRLIAAVDDPLPRYAYLEDLARHGPGDQIGFLLENFYSESDAPELFAIRLMSGAALWRAENESG
jgi:HEAT repeat protein